MNIDVTIRHVELSDKLQQAARDKAAKLGESFPSIESVKVVLDQDGPNYLASVDVQGGRQMNASASHRDTDAAGTLAAAFDKAQAQLRKLADKRDAVR